MRLATLIGVGLALAAAQASAAPPLVAKASVCLEASDLPICLLKIVAAEDSGDSLARDRELAARPEILTAAGVTPEGVARYRTTEKGLTGQMFYGPGDQADETFAKVLAADRAGRPPAEALAPVATLSRDASKLPPLFAGGQETSARLIVYRLVVRSEPNTLTPGPSPSLQLIQASLKAWEADLIERGGLADEFSCPGSLASAYAAHGDLAGIERAISLEPRPDNRIKILIDLGRIEEARQAATRLTARDLEPSVRADTARWAASQHAAKLGEASFRDRLIEEEIVKYRASGQDVSMFEDLRIQNRRLVAALAKASPKVPERLVRQEAAVRLERIRGEAERAAPPRTLSDIESFRAAWLAPVLGARAPMNTTPGERLRFAEAAVTGGASAARWGDAESARILMVRGLTVARDLESGETSASTLAMNLIELAKVELRTDGRLPPRPNPQTMIGRAP